MLLHVDECLFRLVNDRLTWGLMDAVAPAFQDAWLGWVLSIPLAALILKKGGRKAPYILMAAILSVALSDLACTYLLKPLVARPRPTMALEGVRMLVGRKSGYGFPSNHAANITALTWTLGMYFRSWWWILIPAALLVGYSRIYVGVHYPLDVAGGLCVGLIMGTISFFALGKIESKFGPGR